jgi:hypothetical protein
MLSSRQICARTKFYSITQYQHTQAKYGYFMTDYCNCKEFEKAVDYDDIKYYRLIDDNFHRIKKPGWYIRSWAYDGPTASLEPFKYCPWCAKELTKPLKRS